MVLSSLLIRLINEILLSPMRANRICPQGLPTYKNLDFCRVPINPTKQVGFGRLRGASIIKIGSWAKYSISIIRNTQNPTLVIKAPTVA